MFNKQDLPSRFFILLFFVFAMSGSGISVCFAQTEDLDVRIKRQMYRINRGMEEGNLHSKQAKELKDTLNGIALQVESAHRILRNLDNK